MDDRQRNFFERLPPILDQAGTFERANYRPAPDDWLVAVGDVENSTGAIARGLYRPVNFVAAAMIAALKNLCAPQEVPFLFAGDGAVTLVPPEREAGARQALARVRTFTRREYGLTLRVGLVPVAEIRRRGAEILVGRFEPSPGNPFGVFQGGGVARLEQALKGRSDGDLAALAVVPESLDDGAPPDLTGLSCRWDELRSARGHMVSLIITGSRNPAQVHRRLLQIAARTGDPRPVRRDNLTPRWPPKGLMIEARARRGRWPAPLMAAVVLAESLFAWLVLVRDKPLGGFDPQVYKREISTNTDFSQCDEVVNFVLDCDEEAIAEIRRELDAREAAGELRYGLHLSDTALMTCIVTSLAEHQHAHFVDGGDGGYAMAARALKSPALS
ncbi:MAG: DUF3095 domain-containing protein [Alsobacter sp.]